MVLRLKVLHMKMEPTLQATNISFCQGTSKDDVPVRKGNWSGTILFVSFTIYWITIPETQWELSFYLHVPLKLYPYIHYVKYTRFHTSCWGIYVLSPCPKVLPHVLRIPSLPAIFVLLFAAGIENFSSWNVKDHFSAMLKHKRQIMLVLGVFCWKWW